MKLDEIAMEVEYYTAVDDTFRRVVSRGGEITNGL